MTGTIGQLRAAFPRRFGGDILGLTVLAWLGYLAVIAAIEIAIAIWGGIDESLWSQLSQIPSWYIAFMGGYISYTLLPMHIAHGMTRREFGIQIALFLPVFAVFSAILMTIGYPLERIFYEINGWQQEIGREHIFTSATEYHRIFLEFLLVFLVWGAVGVVVGAAWYRSTEAGALSLLFATIPLGVTSIALSAQWGPVGSAISWVAGDPGRLPLGIAIVACLAIYALTLAVAWQAIRDIPISSLSR